MAISNEDLVILRERLFLDHPSADEREITEEITLLNTSPNPIPSIFLFKDDFMIGLKVFDEADNELPLYTNNLTRQLLLSFAGPSPDVFDPYRVLVRRMLNHEVYVLWIRLPDDSQILSNEPKIIKLIYKNMTKPRKFGLSDFDPRKFRFLFSIPQYRTERRKPAQRRYDTFYIIKIPDGMDIEYEGTNVAMLPNNTLVNLTGTAESYTDLDTRIISIHPATTEQASYFDLRYEILPDRGERWFYALAALGILTFSVIVAATAILGIDPKADPNTINPTIKKIYDTSDALLGAGIASALAALSLIKNSLADKTRFYFAASVVISALGYFLRR